MNTVEFVLFLMMLSSIFIAGYFLIPFMGVKDFLFTKEEMNCVKAIMCGGHAVKFVGCITTDNDENPGMERHVDERTGEILLGPAKPSWLSKHFGLRYVGIPGVYSIYRYTFRWLKWSIKPGTTEYGIIPMEKVIDRIMYRATYAAKIVDAETEDRLPVSVVVRYSVELTNAMLALFNTTNWLSEIEASISAAIRDFVAKHKYNDLVAIQGEISRSSVAGSQYSDFVSAILLINETGIGNKPPIKSIGVKIDSINLMSLEVGEPKGEIGKKTMEVYTAEQEATATIKKAEADARAKVMAAEAEAKRIDLESAAEAERNRRDLASVGGDQEAYKQLITARAIAQHQGAYFGGNGIAPAVAVAEGGKGQ